jgi:aspartyl-tRNA(Asn)/glutamyl-tRNA(Gln) amidotransferase subunit A
VSANAARSALELRLDLHARRCSAEQLAREGLARIAASGLNAFLDVQPELTLAQARAADERLAAIARAGDDWRTTPLLGVPIAHKDIFVTRGWKSTAGSRMLADYVSPFDAAVVERLAAAGAVCLGKTHCDEFAMGSANENPHFGPVRNPWDESRISGGSSGGSAAAVAAGLVPLATGTDTGGSVRQPAAMCGVTGIKPTYGRVSRYGMIAYASSLDQAGAIGRDATDCALLLAAMAGFDGRDSTSLETAVPDWLVELAGADPAAAQPLAGLRIGLPDEFFGAGVDDGVLAAVRQGLAALERLGATARPIRLPRTDLAIPAYYTIAPAEASSNLSRFDGVRYGHRASRYRDLDDMYAKTRAEGFGAEVKRRIIVGTYVLSHGYYDAYYVKAQQLRRLIADDFRTAFAEVDVIAGPVAPTTAWRIGEQTDDPVSNYLADIFTLPASLAGLPAMSLPCGADGGGLPVGLQLIAPWLEEGRLLRCAVALQRVTDWHRARAGRQAAQGARPGGEMQ